MKHENLKSLFTDIAEAIRTKTGSTDTIVADDFPEVIRGIEAGGGSADFDAFIDGAIIWFHSGTEITEDMVPDSGFDAVYCPNATSIGDNAFRNCDALTTVSLPNATHIGGSAFNSCNTLASVSLPNATSIGEYAFYSCNTLASVILPNTTSIGEYAFYSCVALKSIDLPCVTSIGHIAFSRSNGIFDTLILRSATMCDMAISAIVDTKIIDITGTPTGEGFVYVPTALYESYIADWIPKIIEFATANGMSMDEPTATYIATAILRKLEDYTVDGTITGELDESKI